jgi:hypothetical protein
MPRRSAKSRSKATYHANKPSETCDITDNVVTKNVSPDAGFHENKGTEHMNKSNMASTNDDISDTPIRIAYVNIVCGNFNQGDPQFSTQSRGVQCSCNSLVMLCCLSQKFPHVTSTDIDNCLRYGDNLYKTTADELLASGKLHETGYIDNEQLPTSLT